MRPLAVGSAGRDDDWKGAMQSQQATPRRRATKQQEGGYSYAPRRTRNIMPDAGGSTHLRSI